MKKMKWAGTFALAAALLTSLSPSASAATNEVRNTGAISIGAIEVFDGSYKVPGKYDDLIPPGRFSGYAHTAGLYVGPGHCVRIRGWLYGTEQNPPGPEGLTDPQILTGEKQWALSSAYPGFDVKALAASDPGCKS